MIVAAPEICPNCGADVPPKARACPECGADDETGWSERAAAQRLGIPDDEFNYDEFVKEEFNGAKQSKRPTMGWFWWVIAVGLLIVIAMYFMGLFRL